METDILKDGERFDDLQLHGLQIIQHPEYYCFTSDAVLLANFARAKTGETVIDLGTGSGIIAILLAAKTNAKTVYGIELQDKLYDMACRSVIYNNLQGKVKIIHADMRQFQDIIGYETAEVITVNPPYRKDGSGDKSAKNDSTRQARHEINVSLREVVESAARLLKFGGRFYMIHRADRIDEIFKAMQENNIAVKVMQLVQPDAKKPPHLMLIEGLKGGKPGVIVKNNLIIGETEA